MSRILKNMRSYMVDRNLLKAGVAPSYYVEGLFYNVPKEQYVSTSYGVYLYLVFVWLSLAVIAWVLIGGLRRRRSQGNSAMIIPGIIFTTRPTNQSPPPLVITEIDPVQNDGNEKMDEP